MLANLAVRVVNLLQRIFDSLDGIFGQFNQHGGGVGLEQFRQRIRHLIDIAGKGANLPPVDKAMDARRAVDSPPECLDHVAATAATLGLEQQRLIEPVVALGNIEHKLDQGFRRLRDQIRLDIAPWIAPLLLARCGA